MIIGPAQCTNLLREHANTSRCQRLAALIARLANRMQFDPQINTERDQLSETVKMKSASRGIKILQINWFQPFQTFNRFASFKSLRNQTD